MRTVNLPFDHIATLLNFLADAGVADALRIIATICAIAGALWALFRWWRGKDVETQIDNLQTQLQALQKNISDELQVLRGNVGTSPRSPAQPTHPSPLTQTALVNLMTAVAGLRQKVESDRNGVVSRLFQSPAKLKECWVIFWQCLRCWME